MARGGAGALDHRVTLQRRVEAHDGMGGTELRWVSVADVWAAVMPKSGRETLVEGRVNATYTVVFEIWNRSDVSEVSQIIWNGQAYNVRSVLQAGYSPLKLRFEAEAGVAA